MSDKIRVYLLRVDENSGTIYKGYIAEMKKSLDMWKDYVNYNKPNSLISTVRLTEGIAIIRGMLLGMPLNRILAAEDEKPLDVLLGNLMCIRFDDAEGLADIKDEDIPIIEKFLRPAGKPWGTYLAESELPEYKESGADANTDQ